MKKFSWKKIVSLVVAIALVVSVAHFGTRVSADGETQNTGAKASATNGLNDDQDAIDYAVTRQDFSEKGKATIVLLVDNSASMDDRVGRTTKLALANDAADKFVAAIKKAYGDSVTVERVNFATKAGSNDRYGTNVDDALEVAEGILKSAEGGKAIVILTDGLPTYANDLSQSDGLAGNGFRTSSEIEKVDNLTKAEIKAALAIAPIYAIKYGNDDSIFYADDIQNLNGLTNKDSSVSAEALAATFDKIAEDIQHVITAANITAELGDFIQYVPQEGDAAKGLVVNGKSVTWTCDVDADPIAVSLGFIIAVEGVDPSDKKATVEALVRYKVANPNDNSVSYTKTDNGNNTYTVTVTVDVTKPGTTVFKYYIDGQLADTILLDKDVALTATFELEEMPQDTWTVVYTLDGETVETDEPVTFKADCDKTLAEIEEIAAGYTLKAYDENEDYDLGDIVATDDEDGKIVTIPYTSLSTDWTIKYFVYNEETGKYDYQGENFNNTISRKPSEGDVTEDFVKNDYKELRPITEFIADASTEDYTFEVEAGEDNVFEVKYSKVADTVWSLEYYIYDPEKDENVQVGTTHPEFRRTYPSTKASMIAEFEKDNSFKLSDAPSDYKDDDYRLVSHKVDENDHVLMVIFAAKDVLTVTYKIEGQEDKIDSITLDNDEPVIITEKDLLKVSDIYKDLNDNSFEMTSFTKDSDFAYTVVYELKADEYEVDYVVEGAKENPVYKETGIIIKYDPKTGKEEFNIDEYMMPVSELVPGFVDGDYKTPAVSKTVKDEITVYTITYLKKGKEKPPIIPVPTPDPTPTPTEIPATPTPTPTETPDTPTPTETPATPTPEPEIEVEEPETPEGDVEIDEPETPEGAPEEEVEVDLIDTPQGDLPQTGVAPASVFFGIGAACVAFGGMIVIKLRRKEEI